MGDPVQSETLWTRFSLLQQIGRYCLPLFTSAPLLSTKWTFNIPMEGIEKPHDYSGQHSSQTQLRPSLSLRYSLQPTEQIPAWDTPHSIHSIAIER